MATTTTTRAAARGRAAGRPRVDLEFKKATLCPVGALDLDYDNPRLQTGDDIDTSSDKEVVEALVNIAALDELVLSICTNKYLNLEPLIVIGPDGGPYKVIEGNRRLASIHLINDPAWAAELGITVPQVSQEVRDSIKSVLVYRVADEDDARAFIGFKHINGPQRWDAYAKAKYVTDWYRSANGAITVDDIAAKMGDNNNTLRSYIYAVLILDQAEKANVWSLRDRPLARGRFPFSHLYTAISRVEYQELLGLTSGWSNRPPLKPIKKANLEALGEVLTYLYGSVSQDRASLIKSQNPDLKDLGVALQNEKARVALRNGATLDQARDEVKEPETAFHDALVLVNLRLGRAIELLKKYPGGNDSVDELIREIFDQADTLKTMSEKKKRRARA